MNGLEYIFRPKSVAVIGASTRKGTIGREILHNIILNEFNGKVFPVNPKATVIHSIKCFPIGSLCKLRSFKSDEQEHLTFISIIKYCLM